MCLLHFALHWSLHYAAAVQIKRFLALVLAIGNSSHQQLVAASITLGTYAKQQGLACGNTSNRDSSSLPSHMYAGDTLTTPRSASAQWYVVLVHLDMESFSAPEKLALALGPPGIAL